MKALTCYRRPLVEIDGTWRAARDNSQGGYESNLVRRLQRPGFDVKITDASKAA
jgi:hypothetical protein